ncbi:MAG: EamA family transporter, partial [Burkholderiales bacterium]
MNNPLRLAPRDLWLLALLTLSWGVNWPVMKVGVQELPPMTFRALTMLGGLPVLAAIAHARGVPLRVPREHWRELFTLALTNMVLWLILAIYGVKLLASGRAAILAYTMPIWAALIGIVVFAEHPSRRLWVGVVAAALGVLLLV